MCPGEVPNAMGAVAPRPDGDKPPNPAAAAACRIHQPKARSKLTDEQRTRVQVVGTALMNGRFWSF